MGHAGQIADNVATVDVAPEGNREFLLSFVECRGLQSLAQTDRRNLCIGNLQTNACKARDRRFDAYAWRRQSKGQITLKLGNTSHLDAISGLKGKLCHCRPWIYLPHLGLDLEAGKRFFDKSGFSMEVVGVRNDIVVKRQA